MERYAPTIKDLAPRDMVARAIYTEVREGRGCGPDGRLRLPRPDAPARRSRSTRSCPDITEFARTYLGVEPVHRARSRSIPTAHYAMGGIPTNVEGEVLRRQHDVVPGPVRRRRGRLRLGARRQPAGHQLAAGHQRVRPAGRHRRRRVRRDGRLRRAAGGPGALRRSTLVERLRDATGERAGRRDPHASCRRRWTSTRRCSAPRRRSSRRSTDIAELQGALPQRRRSRTRASGSTPTCWRPSSWASCSTWPRSWWSSALARKESRGGHFREDYPNRDDVNFMRHTMAYREVGADGTESHPARLQAGRPDPLPADGAQVLMSHRPS